MNSLERKWVRERLQSLPCLTKFEVCNKLQPLVTQFGLTFTENKICFPQPLVYQQHAIYVCARCEKLYEKTVPQQHLITKHININSGNKIRKNHVSLPMCNIKLVNAK